MVLVDLSSFQSRKTIPQHSNEISEDRNGAVALSAPRLFQSPCPKAAAESLQKPARDVGSFSLIIETGYFIFSFFPLSLAR